MQTNACTVYNSTGSINCIPSASVTFRTATQNPMRNINNNQWYDFFRRPFYIFCALDFSNILHHSNFSLPISFFIVVKPIFTFSPIKYLLLDQMMQNYCSNSRRKFVYDKFYGFIAFGVASIDTCKKHLELKITELKLASNVMSKAIKFYLLPQNSTPV